MQFALRGAGILLALLAMPHPILAQRAHTNAEWREDLRFLAAELPKRHREPFHKISRTTFDSAVAALDAKIPRLRDHEVVVGLTEIVALLGDGHTRLTLPQDPAVGFDRAHTATLPPNDSSLFFHHLPVRFAHFEDGLFIRAATAEHRHLIGARVLRIGRLSADSALEAMRAVTHYDNEYGFKLMAARMMLPIPEVLHARAVISSLDTITVTVDARGQTSDVRLVPVVLFSKPRFIEAGELMAARPLSQRNPDAWYWLSYLAAERTLYVQLNRNSSAQEENITAFVQRMMRVVADSGAQRLVLDLRYNPGGNNNMNRPVVHALLNNDTINRFGRLFVLIGRETFSAAQMLVNDLERGSQALFVGEPTGSSPSAYGDSRRFRLPQSGLTVRASTIYWRDHDGNEKRPWTPPDLSVPVRASDYFAGRDAAMEEALRFPINSTPTALADTVQQRGGWPQAMRVCWNYAADYQLNAATRAAGALACGHLLAQRSHKDVAVQWFQAISDYLPDEPAVYEALAPALTAVDKPQEAEAARRQAQLLRAKRR